MLRRFGGRETDMSFRYTLLSGVIFAASLASAQAQSPFPPAGGQAAFPSGGQAVIPQGGFGMQQQQPQQQQQAMPPCIEKFMPLRDEMDKRFGAAKAALARKPPNPADACAHLTKFSQAQMTAIKYIQQNNNPATCPFPPGMADTMKASNVQTEEVRKQACAAASAPPRSAGPTLSDALSPPPFTKDNTKTGGGTLDSLFGKPIAR
jgi:hypothetical protein